MRDIILAFMGSFFPAVVFNIDRKNLLWASFSGVIGWEIFLIVNNITDSVIFSIFIGAFMVGIYGEIMARILKYPASIFTIPGIFPLVPGIAAYNTVLAIVENRISEAFNKGVETMASAGAIAFGIMLASALFKFIREDKNNEES